MTEIPPDAAREQAMAWLRSPPAERYARRLLAAPPPLIEDPEDVLQDTRVKILVRFPGPWAKPIGERGFPEGYCKAVMHRVVIDKRNRVLGGQVPLDDVPELPDPDESTEDEGTDAALFAQLAAVIHSCCNYSEPGEQAAVALWFAQCRWFGGVDATPLPYPGRRESSLDECWWQAVAAIYPSLRKPVPDGPDAKREKARRRDLKRRMKDHAAAALRCAARTIGWDPPEGDLD